MWAVVAPYLKPMRPARVLGDVAAHGARRLAGRIGRKEEAARKPTPWDIARLTMPVWTRAVRFSISTSRIRFSRFIATTTPPSTRDSTPGESRSCASAHERDPRCCTDSDHLRYLFCRARQYYRFRRALESGGPVTFVNQDVLGPHQVGHPCPRSALTL